MNNLKIVVILIAERFVINMIKSEEILKVRKKLGITRKEFSDALQFTFEQEKSLKDWETGQKNIPEEIYQKIMSFPTEPVLKNPPKEQCKFTMIDLFAGIGGIRQAFQSH